MKSYRITLEGQTFDVVILTDPCQDQVQVQVNGVSYTVSVAAPPRQEQAASQSASPAPIAPAAPSAPKTRTPSPPSLSSDSSRLVAPLPGTIIQISVKPGQQVSAGDELLVIDAMKMNNRIRSPRNGTVGEIFVGVGEQVNHGAALLAWAE